MSVVIERLPEIGATRLSRWIFNCYVIEGDDGPVVVDAGLPDVVRDLEAHLGDRRPAAVVATHGHCDHLSGIPRLAERWDVPVHLPALTLPYLDGEVPRQGKRWQALRLLPILCDQPFDLTAARGFARSSEIAGYKLTGPMTWSGPEPTGGLGDGDVVPGASEWRIIDAAGHTDDSIALWHEGTGTLLSGDAVLSARGRPRPAVEQVDRQAADATLAALRELAVRHLLPGHGRPVHAPDVWSLLGR